MLIYVSVCVRARDHLPYMHNHANMCSCVCVCVCDKLLFDSVFILLKMLK
jgi:hypothetical protein